MDQNVKRGIPIDLRLMAAIVGIVGIVGAEPAHAHSNDWAAPFMGGIMAGHVLSGFQQQRREQTEAMQEMARGGGGYGGYRGYGGGYGYRPPYYGPPPQYGAPPPAPGCP